ncbi:MAG: ligand-gated TonB-dependent outer rane channel [Verrucomicrobiales bacterium]|nr:ligand-gated TonB-dependent outer rane channel [Verrucomicrobiales bacterium]
MSVRFLFIVLSVMAAALPCRAQSATNTPPAKIPREIRDIPLEELVNVEVFSTGRKPEPLAQTPAAIAVVTQEDIRRSGVTSIPEALRLVPGMQVARVDSHTWAISARGFNDVFANKLLVMQDGRSLYTPLFSGVFWDIQDTVLEDIDRIEVIRGPGATLWGANAVNGIINIITKSAKDTQGLLVTAGGGTEERGFTSIRYGDKLAENLYFRVFGKYLNRDEFAQPNGHPADDAWQLGRGGFRMDWEPPGQNTYTFQGEAYGGLLNQVYTVPPGATLLRDENVVRGGYMLGRWAHVFSDTSDTKLQFYYDRAMRDTAVFTERRDTVDLDFQHHIQFGERHDVVWGVGYRVHLDKVDTNLAIALSPPQRHDQIVSSFLQDEITLVPEKLRFTIGSKFEDNEYTGFEVQPNARLSWTPNNRQTFWGAVSRAVRTPARVESDIRFTQQTPFGLANISGNPAFQSEKMIAYELGHRAQFFKHFSIDIATFYNDYDDLRTIEPVGGNPLLLTGGNNLRGETYGIEIGPTWRICEWWRLSGAYSFLEIQLHRKTGSLDPNAERDEGRSPQQQFTLRSSWDLPWHLELDAQLRYADRLPDFNIPSYLVMDVHLGWRPNRNLELALVGQNLMAGRHREFEPSSLVPTQQTAVQHSLYGKVTWRF